MANKMNTTLGLDFLPRAHVSSCFPTSFVGVFILYVVQDLFGHYF